MSIPPKNIPTIILITNTATVNLITSALVGQVTFLSSSSDCLPKVIGETAIYFKSASLGGYLL